VKHAEMSAFLHKWMKMFYADTNMKKDVQSRIVESIKNLMALRDGDLANGKHPMVVYW
jgi:hypothetical protein